MKVKFGSLVVAGSGKIGGHVVSNSQGGRVLKTKGLNYSKGKNFGLIGQGNISQFSSTWATLSQADRDSFNIAAKNALQTDVFGDNVKISGFNLFVRLNSHAKMGGFAPVTAFAPPAVKDSFSIFSTFLDLSGAYIVVNFVGAPAVGTILLSYLALPVGVGISRRYRQFDFAASGVVVAGYAVFNLPASSPLRNLPIGTLFDLKVCIVVADGSISNFVESAGSVVA